MKLTQARLRELLHYEPSTGVFTWRRAPGFRRDLDGAPAGVAHESGRVEIMIDYVNHKAHRLAFLYMMGRWPDPEVDHRDGNAGNNEWINLREATRVLNQQNLRKAHADNLTGMLGVTPKRGRYQASIYANGTRHNLGVHDTAEQAHAAYVTAKRRLHEGCTL